MLLAGDPISLFQAVVIGLVEGLTEFLPVSSTGHMLFVPQLFGWDDPGAAFSAIVQLGPIVAILAYFRHDLARYLRGMWRTKFQFRRLQEDTDARMGWYTLLASLPILLVGKLLEHSIEGPFRSLNVVAGALIIYSLILWMSEKIGKRSRTLEQVTFLESLFVGVMQCFALIPGVSRSGATISAALFRNIDYEGAARFSFLLTIPVLTAAGIYEFYKDFLKAGSAALNAPLVVGTLVAGVSAFLVIGWFLNIVKRYGTGPFLLYRIVVGLVLIGLLQAGIVKDSQTTAQREERTVVSSWQEPSRPRLSQGGRYVSSGRPTGSEKVQEGRER